MTKTSVNFSERYDENDINSVAVYWEKLYTLLSQLEEDLKEAGKILLDNGETIYLENGKKITYVAPTEVKTLIQEKVIDFFVKSDRWNDLVKVVSVNQSSLERELADGKKLIDYFKEREFFDTKPKAPSLRLSNQTNEELMEHTYGRTN